MPAKTPLDAISVPCGAGVDLLLEQAAQGRGADWDAHQQACAHCQAALRELTALWEPVAKAATGPVSAPPGLVAAVMSQVRRLVHDIWYTLESTELGTVRIAARTVAALARDSARMIPGVRVASAAALTARSLRSPRRPPSGTGTRTPPSGCSATRRLWT